MSDKASPTALRSDFHVLSCRLQLHLAETAQALAFSYAKATLTTSLKLQSVACDLKVI